MDWWMAQRTGGRLRRCQRSRPFSHRQASVKFLPMLLNHVTTKGLVSLLDNYTVIYDRSSEAGCRVALDFLLCECIAVIMSFLDVLLTILLKKA